MNAILRILAAMAMAFTLYGCDGGGGGDAAPSVDVTGTWRGTSTFSGNTNGEILRLVQTGGNVSGVDDDGTNYSGSVSGKKLNLVASLSEGADFLSLDISGNVEGNSMVLSGRASGKVRGTNIDGPLTFNLRR